MEQQIQRLEIKVQNQLKENSLLLEKLKTLSESKSDAKVNSIGKLIKNPSLDLDTIMRRKTSLEKEVSQIKDNITSKRTDTKDIESQKTHKNTEHKDSVIDDPKETEDTGRRDTNDPSGEVDDSKDTSANDDTGKSIETEAPQEKPVIPILLFACNRVTVNKALDLLLAYRPDKEQFPIIVTQDCGHKETANVIKSYGDKIVHIQQPDLSEPIVPPKEKKFRGYFKIARHYGWALNQTFNEFGYDQVILVEDDLEISPDFYEYFLATLPILRSDTSLLCVSAWNDNGKQGNIDETASNLLYRTDFFPGLGWMLTKEIWAELSVKWARSYWDDWLREPKQRRDRSCIRPEISRTKTFGKVGVSNGLFFEKHLKYIVLNQKFVPFTVIDLNFLKKDNYDESFVKKVYETPVVSLEDLKNGRTKDYKAVRVTYHTRDVYKKSAKALGIMDDFKSGVPRMAYRGIVSFMFKGLRVYLSPNLNWSGYDPKWA